MKPTIQRHRHRSSLFARVFIIALASTCCTQTLATTLIDTTETFDPDGRQGVGPFGEPNGATMGQTFTVPMIDYRLDTFSFWVSSKYGPGPVDFAAYVMPWDGSRATGPVLYESFPQSVASTNKVRLDFDTDGLELTPGAEYVAFLSASQFFDGVMGTGAVGANYTNVYSGGSLVFQNNGPDFSSLTNNPWSSAIIGIEPGSDLAFVAEFNVPEPFTITLVLIGLAGFCSIRRAAAGWRHYAQGVHE